MDEQLLDKIQAAVESGSAATMRSIFAQQPELIGYKRNGHGWLSAAVYSQDIEKVKTLIELGIDVNQENSLTSSITTIPLDTALNLENVEIARILLETGANPNQNRQIIAAVNGSKHALQLVKLLDQHGVDLHKEFENKNTNEVMNALSMAVDLGNEEVADYLRSRGCVLPGDSPETAKSFMGQTPGDEIIEFFRDHFGPVSKQSLVEVVEGDPAIAVHVIPSSKDRDRVTLFTTGMSSRPMVGDPGFSLGELFVELPGDWNHQDLNDPNDNWPVLLLRGLAKAPHQQQTSLGVAQIVEIGGPVAPGRDFDSVLLLAEREVHSASGDIIRLYRMTPLYPEERKLALDKDLATLMRAFDERDVDFVFDLKRINVAMA